MVKALYLVLRLITWFFTSFTRQTKLNILFSIIFSGLLARVAAECGRNGRMVEETTLSSTEIEAMMGAADSEEILDADLVLSMDQTCSIP